MFIEKFEKLCRKRGVAPTTALANCGIAKNNYRDWKNKDNYIPVARIVKLIADYFGVDVEYFYSEDTSEETPTTTFDIFEELKNDPAKRLLFSAMQGATSQEIEQAAMILETLKKTRK